MENGKPGQLGKKECALPYKTNKQKMWLCESSNNIQGPEGLILKLALGEILFPQGRLSSQWSLLVPGETNQSNFQNESLCSGNDFT